MMVLTRFIKKVASEKKFITFPGFFCDLGNRATKRTSHATYSFLLFLKNQPRSKFQSQWLSMRFMRLLCLLVDLELKLELTQPNITQKADAAGEVRALVCARCIAREAKREIE
jgi:hypothetical protein